MRNLWNLIIRYQVILVFATLQFLALRNYFSSRGYPRGQWIQSALTIEGAWQEKLAGWEHLKELDEMNRLLLAENADLRGRMMQKASDSMASADPQVLPAEIIRSTWTRSHNFIVLDRGSEAGIISGSGVIADGNVVGRVVEVSNDFALALSLAHTSLEWSARVGRTGSVGRLIWDGRDIRSATLVDVPRLTPNEEGDSIFSTGFQGIFPPDLLFGTVSGEAIFDGEFLNLPIQFATDFQRLRYVQVVSTSDNPQLDSLMETIDFNTP